MSVLPRALTRRAGAVLGLGAVVVASLFLTTCAPGPNALGAVERSGVLTVASLRRAPSGANATGIAALNQALAWRFARALGVRLETVVCDSRENLRREVLRGRARFAMASARPRALGRGLRTTPGYDRPALLVVAPRADSPASSLADFAGRLAVAPASGVVGWLGKHYPELELRVARAATGELLQRVAAGRLDAAVASRAVFVRYRRYYPNLAAAFELRGAWPQAAWLFAGAERGGRDALYYRAVAFIRAQKRAGKLAHLQDRHLDSGAALGAIGRRAFARRAQQRLTRWRADFERAARRYGLDWRLLAALSYQESQWQPGAVSPTHVKGLMMLTRAAASQVGIDDRAAPRQSIIGGARYLLHVRERLPAAVAPPDRNWFALAAYNIGLGHVLDARRLLARRGDNPNLWVNLRRALALLEQPRYAKRAAHGVANGDQAVAYVAQIRAYYDMLRWQTTPNTGPALAETLGRASRRARYAPITLASPMF